MVVADHELRVPAGSNNDVLDTTKCERREDVVSGKRGTMMMYSVGCLVVSAPLMSRRAWRGRRGKCSAEHMLRTSPPATIAHQRGPNRLSRLFMQPGAAGAAGAAGVGPTKSAQQAK
ncbi:hypothetical protein MY8738_005732 [Beauveria namnaoensis]